RTVVDSMKHAHSICQSIFPLLKSDPTLAAKTNTRRGWGTRTLYLGKDAVNGVPLFFAALIAEGFGEDVEVAVGLRRSKAEDVRHPGIEVDILKGNDGLAVHYVGTGSEEAGLHLRHGAGIEAMRAGDGRGIELAWTQRVGANGV